MLVGSEIATNVVLSNCSFASSILYCDCISIQDSAERSKTYESLTAISGDTSASPERSLDTADFETFRWSASFVWVIPNSSKYTADKYSPGCMVIIVAPILRVAQRATLILKKLDKVAFLCYCRDTLLKRNKI